MLFKIYEGRHIPKRQVTLTDQSATRIFHVSFDIRQWTILTAQFWQLIIWTTIPEKNI